MSLIFKPKFSPRCTAPSPASRKPIGKKAPDWSAKELEQLVALRSHGVAFLEVSRLLEKSIGSCAQQLNSKNLHEAVLQNKKSILQGIMG
jgi:hypothetical protein|tara:strand:+ start:44 stop:313 length:270 start_codon:yes stop_codon:yes gene_type:complete